MLLSNVGGGSIWTSRATVSRPWSDIDASPTAAYGVLTTVNGSESALSATRSLLWPPPGGAAAAQPAAPVHWLVLLSLLATFGMGSNALVILAIAKVRQLRTQTNCIMASLATTDLLICAAVMPIGIVQLAIGYWPLPDSACSLWLFCDVCLCTSSIQHMCAISVDRYLGIRYPLKYGSLKSRQATCIKLGAVWLLSAAISAPVFGLSTQEQGKIIAPTAGVGDTTVDSIVSSQNWTRHPYIGRERLGIVSTAPIMTSQPGLVTAYVCRIDSANFQFGASIGAFLVPFVVMTAAYLLTGRILHRQLQTEHGAFLRRERPWRPIAQTDALQRPDGESSAEHGAGLWQRAKTIGRLVSRSIAHRGSAHRNSDAGKQDAVLYERHAIVVGFRLAHTDCDVPQGTAATPRDVARRRHVPRRHLGGKVVLPYDREGETSRPLHRRSLMRRQQRRWQPHIGRRGQCAVAGNACEGRIARPDDNDDGGSAIKTARSVSERGGGGAKGCGVLGSSGSVGAGSLTGEALLPETTTRNSASGCRRLVGRATGAPAASPARDVAFSGGAREKATSAEQRASQVLGIVFSAFVVSWSPFFWTNMATSAMKLLRSATVQGEQTAAAEHYEPVDPQLLDALMWLGYVSSLANPIVYTAFSKAFRHTFREIITCRPQAALPRNNSVHTALRQLGVNCSLMAASVAADEVYKFSWYTATALDGDDNDNTIKMNCGGQCRHNEQRGYAITQPQCQSASER